MTTPRSVRHEIANALDFFLEVGLVMYAPTVAQGLTRVTWHAPAPFRFSSGHATAAEYLDWLVGGQYSAVLPDASLIQLTYDVGAGEIVGHRLAYVPCPVIVDQDLLREGMPVGDVVELHLDSDPRKTWPLRSPLRFDYDPGAAGPDHPAAHLTLNGPECRIGCVAPLHPYQFLDFVYTHFYPLLRTTQATWFATAAGRCFPTRLMTDEERAGPHIAWSLD